MKPQASDVVVVVNSETGEVVTGSYVNQSSEYDHLVYNQGLLFFFTEGEWKIAQIHRR